MQFLDCFEKIKRRQYIFAGPSKLESIFVTVLCLITWPDHIHFGRSSTSVIHNSATQMSSSQWPCTLPLLVIIKASLLGLTARISLIIYFALRCQTPIGHVLFVTQLAFSCSTNLISWLELRSLMPAHYPINHKESSSNSFACSPLQNIFQEAEHILHVVRNLLGQNRNNYFCASD